MGNRFGRNKKRKLKEELQRSNDRASSWERAYRKECEAGHRARRAVELTASVLGNHFITLDPQSVEVSRVDGIARGWRQIIPQELSAIDGDWASPVRPVEFLERVLPVIQGSAIENELRGETHVRFTYGDMVVGYGISTRALRLMPQKEAAKIIAGEMAEYLRQEIFGSCDRDGAGF